MHHKCIQIIILLSCSFACMDTNETSILKASDSQLTPQEKAKLSKVTLKTIDTIYTKHLLYRQYYADCKSVYQKIDSIKTHFSQSSSPYQLSITLTAYEDSIKHLTERFKHEYSNSSTNTTTHYIIHYQMPNECFDVTLNTTYNRIYFTTY